MATERSKAQQLEAERALLDRQNKELRAKLDEVDSQNKARAKASQQAFESKIANLEEQLDAEMRQVVKCFEFCESLLDCPSGMCGKAWLELQCQSVDELLNISFNNFR